MTNPIFVAEHAHQQRRLPRRTRIEVFVVGVALLSALALFIGEFIGRPLFVDPLLVVNPLGVVTIVFHIIIAAVLHFGFMLQTLQLGADSIAREHRNSTWELLLLTGIDARRLVVGKWWATVRTMLPSYFMLAVLRALVIAWLGASGSRHYARLSFYSGLIIEPVSADFLMSAGVVFSLTMMNLLFTAACGVSAVSAGARSTVLVFARALATRLILLFGFSISPIAMMSVVWSNRSQLDYSVYAALNETSNLIRTLSTTIVDNGVTLGTQLVDYRFADLDTNLRVGLLPIAVIVLLLYGLLTALLLGFARWQAVRQNVSRSPIRKTSP